MQNALLRKGLVLGIILLFIGTNVIASIGKNIENISYKINGTSSEEKSNDVIEKTNNPKDPGRGTLFSDDFNDNMIDPDKWTEVMQYNQGIWEETNQRCEFEVDTPGDVGEYEAIDSTSFTVSLSPQVGLSAKCHMISNIFSTVDSGTPRFYLMENGGNDIAVEYWRNYNQLNYKDTIEQVWHTLEYRDDGDWDAEIIVYSDRYKVIADGYDSGWVYTPIFSSNPTLNVRLFVKSYTNYWGTLRVGFDNVLVQGENQPPAGGNILVYSTCSAGVVYDKTCFNVDLPTILGNYGYTTTVTDRIITPELTSSLLGNYDELWFLSAYPPVISHLSQSEINAILDFRNQGHGLLIMADHTDGMTDYSDDANQISVQLGVTFFGVTYHGPNGGKITPNFNSHPLFSGITTIVGHESEGALVANSPVQVVATYAGSDLIAVLDDGCGRVVFDVSFCRVFNAGYNGYNWILTGDTPQYVRNIADWLSGGGSQPPEILGVTFGGNKKLSLYGNNPVYQRGTPVGIAVHLSIKPSMLQSPYITLHIKEAGKNTYRTLVLSQIRRGFLGIEYLYGEFDRWKDNPEIYPVGNWTIDNVTLYTDNFNPVHGGKKTNFYVIFDYEKNDCFVETDRVYFIQYPLYNDFPYFSFSINPKDDLKFRKFIEGEGVDGQVNRLWCAENISKLVQENHHPDINPVCWDKSKAMVEWCRAVGIPSRGIRLTGIQPYAWDLLPCDLCDYWKLHGVVEVKIDDKWYHFDPTGDSYGENGGYGCDYYAKNGGYTFRPSGSGKTFNSDAPPGYGCLHFGFYACGATLIDSHHPVLIENVYERYTYCADIADIIFLDEDNEWGEPCPFTIIVKNTGDIRVDTFVYLKVDYRVSFFGIPIYTTTVFCGTLNGGMNPDEIDNFDGTFNLTYIGSELCKHELVVSSYYIDEDNNNIVNMDTVAEEILGLCFNPLSKLIVDGDPFLLENSTMNSINYTSDVYHEKELYTVNASNLLYIYNENNYSKNYQKKTISLENIDSIDHTYSFSTQLVGNGDIIYIPNIGNLTEDITNLNVSVGYFIVYTQSEGTNGNVTLYKFSSNATIHDIDFSQNYSVNATFLNVSWNVHLTPNKKQGFHSYVSVRDGNGEDIHTINTMLGEEIVDHNDSLVYMSVSHHDACKIGENITVNVSLFNNGETEENLSISLKIFKMAGANQTIVNELFYNTQNVTVLSKRDAYVDFMVHVPSDTDAGSWDIIAESNKGSRTSSNLMIEDAFNILYSENITVPTGSVFQLNTSIRNNWNTSVHNVTISLELNNFFLSADPLEKWMEVLAPHQEIVLTWNLSGNYSGFWDVSLVVNSIDGGRKQKTVSISYLALPYSDIEYEPIYFEENITYTFLVNINNTGDYQTHNVTIELLAPENVTVNNSTKFIECLANKENQTVMWNITSDVNHSYVMILNISSEEQQQSYDIIARIHTHQPPLANFTFSPLNPQCTDIVHFYDLSYDPDGNLINWTWDFDEGNISYQQNPVHSYSNFGNYTVTLTVTDNDDTSENVSKNVVIQYLIIKYLQSAWNFVSLPFNQSVDKTNLNVKYNGSDYSWQEAVNQSIIIGFIYTWNRTTQNYGLTDTLIPGNGYWMYGYHNCELRANGVNVFASEPYITDLLPNWNIIGSPDNEPVEKQNLTIRYNGTVYTWQEAVTNSIILGFIYQWNETNQNYQLTDILQPGKSYWMYAYHNCILLRPTI